MISPERREEKRRERKGRDKVTHSTGGSHLKEGKRRGGKGREGTKLHIVPDDLT